MRHTHALSVAKRILFQKKGAALFSVFTLSIASGGLFVFLSFSRGIEEMIIPFFIDRSSPTSIVVSSPQKPMFLEKRKLITNNEVETIRSFPHIQELRRSFVLRFPSSIRVSFFGLTFETDAPFYGFDIKTTKQKDDMIPVFISPFLVDIFNSTIIESTPGVPPVSREKILDMEMDIFFGKSTFFQGNIPYLSSLEKKGFIADFSSEAPFIGVLIPFETAIKINADVSGMSPEDITYQNLFIEVNDIKNIPEIKTKIGERGLSVKSHKDLVEEVQNILSLINTILSFSGGIISLVALITLVSLLSLLLLEQQKNIGIFRVLGAKKQAIFSVFFYISFLLSFSGCVLGICLGYGSSIFLNKWLFSQFSDLSFFTGDLFLFSPVHTILLVVFIVFTALFVSFFPIYKGLKKDPFFCLLAS